MLAALLAAISVHIYAKAASITCTSPGKLVDVIAIASCHGSHGEGIGITQGHEEIYPVALYMDVDFDEDTGVCYYLEGIGYVKWPATPGSACCVV